MFLYLDTAPEEFYFARNGYLALEIAFKALNRIKTLSYSNTIEPDIDSKKQDKNNGVKMLFVLIK